MKYYLLDNEVSNKKTVGKYPQTAYVLGYDFNAPNSMHKLSYFEFPNFIPDLRFSLEKGAKFSDVVNKSNMTADGFLLNTKARTVFEKFKLVPHQYYEATITDLKTNITLPYFWLHLVNNTYEGIDFQRSSFLFTDYSLNRFTDAPTHFENATTFLNYKEQLVNKIGRTFSISIEHLVLTEEIKKQDINLLFFAGGLFSCYIVSEVFIEAVQEAGITGLQWRTQYNGLLSIS
jgi:hypothetical protein